MRGWDNGLRNETLAKIARQEMLDEALPVVETVEPDYAADLDAAMAEQELQMLAFVTGLS